MDTQWAKSPKKKQTEGVCFCYFAEFNFADEQLSVKKFAHFDPKNLPILTLFLAHFDSNSQNLISRIGPKSRKFLPREE